MSVQARIIAALCFALALSATLPSWATDISSWSPTDNSNTSPAPAGAPENMLPSGVNDTLRAIFGAVKRFSDRVQPTEASGGTANVLTLTYDVAPAAYVSGDIYRFIVGTTNTGAATLNVNSLGAKNIEKNGMPLKAGDLFAGQEVGVFYNGSRFELLGPQIYGIPGTVGDGSTDDQPAIQAFLDAMPATGATVYLARGAKYRLGSTLTMPANVTLDCQTPSSAYASVTNPSNANSFNLHKLGGLRLDSSASIMMNTGVHVEHCPILPTGATFPVQTPAAFAGTAITYPAGLTTTNTIDTWLVDDLIVGFAVCVDTTAANTADRLHWINIECDATDGFKVGSIYDTSEIKARTWPWATTGYNGGTPTNTRSGTGLLITGTQRVDDLRIDYLDFGHAIGIDVKDPSGMCCNINFHDVWLDNNATTALRTATGAYFDRLWVWSSGGPAITATANTLRISSLYINGATNGLNLSGTADVSVGIGDFYNLSGVVAVLASNTNRFNVGGGTIDATVATTPYVTLSSPNGMASDAVKAETKYASGLGSNLLGSTSIVPLKSYGDAMTAVTGISAPMVSITGPGQQTPELTDSGAMGGTLMLKGSGLSAGDGGALLLGADKGHNRHFAAIKGSIIDNGSATVGDIDFAARFSGGDAALTHVFHMDHTGYAQIRHVVVAASLQTCTSDLEGSMQPVSDSSTATWGATITGGGSNHVLGYCNGTDWTVMAK